MAPTTKLILFTIIPLFLPPFCSGCIHREGEALLQIKDALNYSSSYTNLSSWEEGGDCCLWAGISCHNTTRHVVSLEIYGDDVFRMEGGVISESLCTLTSLATITLYGMGLKGTIPPCLGNLSSLNYFDVSSNSLRGSIPDSLGNLSLLKMLDLSGNQLSGRILDSLGNLSCLEILYLFHNQLNGTIPDSLGKLSLLRYLSLAYNQLNGTLPSSFSRLSSLVGFYVYGNAFNQSIASSVLPSSLAHLSLSLDGKHMISEAFFDNLSKLETLSLSNCVLNISTRWMPSFQLIILIMRSCKINGEIPLWISTQFSIELLKIVDSNLVGEIPSWLLDMGLLFINLTSNHLQGRLLLNTSARNPLEVLDVSTNALSGQIPSIWPPNITVLLLNDNLLTGNIPPYLQGISSLEIANLANNHLNGIIPRSLANCSKLQKLNLEDNNLKGTIPYEFGKLSELKVLMVKNNHLGGLFPAFISNCTKLYFLDVGRNFLKGHIPKSIKNFSVLKVLAMRKNYFEGGIPAEIGQLKNLQILDLSSNQLSGFIPCTIFSLQAMMIETHPEFSKIQLVLQLESSRIGLTTVYTYKNGLNMNSKGRDEQYTYIFPNMMAIDLSNNQLNGDLPSDLGKLKGLKLLNLSMNNFSGAIPNSIVQLTWLESLDLSTNHFSEKIPPDLGCLNYLGALNFSNNHLSGSIPQGGHMATFQESSYSDNPKLWGCPLPKKCSWPEFAPTPPPISTSINEEEKSDESEGFDIGVGLSYVAGFTIVLVFIVLKKKYFEGVDSILKIFFPWLYNLTL